MTEPMISDASQLVVAVRYQFQSYLRTNRFLALVILVSVITAVVFVVLFNYITPTGVVNQNSGDVSNFIGGSLGFLGLMIFLSAALLGGDAISTDFGARTGYYTLILPIRRRILLLGRFGAAVLTTFLIALLYYFGVTLMALYFFGSAPAAPLLGSIGIALLYCAAAVALAFFFSSLTKSPTLSIVLTVVLLFIVLPIVESLIVVEAQIEPWFSLSYAGQALSMPFIATQHVSGEGRFLAFAPYLSEALGIMVAYLAAFLFFAFLLYEYKESTG